MSLELDDLRAVFVEGDEGACAKPIYFDGEYFFEYVSEAGMPQCIPARAGSPARWPVYLIYDDLNFDMVFDAERAKLVAATAHTWKGWWDVNLEAVAQWGRSRRLLRDIRRVPNGR